MAFNSSLIVEIRRQNSIGRRDMAELLGITDTYLYMLEQGLKEPGRELLRKISEVLGASVDELLRSEKEECDGQGGQDGPASPEIACAFTELKQRLAQERHQRLQTEYRLSEIQQKNDHLMARLKFHSRLGEIFGGNFSQNAKTKRLKKLVTTSAHEGKLSFNEILLASRVKRATLIAWLRDSRKPYPCQFAEGGQIMASFPGEAGLRLVCSCCAALESGECRGHGDEKYPENLGVLVERLEANGVHNRSEQAKITEEAYNVALSPQEISELIYRYKHGLHVPPGIFYLDPRYSRRKKKK